MAYVKGQELQKLIAQVIFQGDVSGLPASFYVGFGHGILPVKDDTLAAVVAKESEVPGTDGYSRLALGRNLVDFPTLALVSGDWKVSSKVLHWASTGDWAFACDFVFLTDVAAGSAGRFFGAVTIDAPFQQLGTDTLDDVFEYQDR